MKKIEDIESINSIKEDLKKICYDTVNLNIQNIFKNISKDYNIPLEELNTKYAGFITPTSKKTPKTKKIVKDLEKCAAKIISGEQCSRYRYEDLKYCKKHSEKLRYGDYN